LCTHDKGKTFSVILGVLQDELKYNVQIRIMDGQHWVPQHRERIVIVGFRDETAFDLNSLNLPGRGTIKLDSILHRTDNTEPVIRYDGDRFFNHEDNKVPDKYTLTDNLWAYLQGYAEKHRSLGNGFGFGLVGKDDVSRTLSARYYKDGSEILIDQGKKKNPRRLTPRECARLMGYPDGYRIPVSDMRAYKQFGNSVVVPMFTAIARAMKPFITDC
ncbi:MAG: DNA (cytosine-5-)-methyltransferase, partial [Rectinemataceae bacterium]|nr:DNA (cytosine-5-)-methyltransferase [Rectinemataceae bacterium]